VNCAVLSADGLEEVQLPFRLQRSLPARAAEQVALDWLGTRIAVGFDDPVAAGLYRRRYARFLTRSPASVRAYAVRDAGGTFFWVEGGRAYRWPHALRDPEAIEFLADYVVRHAYFMRMSRYLSFHAAAVALEREAFALCATSGGGKTTSALACVRRGMPLYSDERCILDGDLVLPFPRAINVRAGALELLCAEPAFDDGGLAERLAGHRGADWQRVDFAELFGPAPTPAPRPLAAIFFIIGRAGSPRVAPMPMREALPALLNAPLRSRSRGLEMAAEATRILARARAYALTLGAPDATALLLRETLR
jgi:hypothetical protein